MIPAVPGSAAAGAISLLVSSSSFFFQPIDLKQKHGEHGEELSVTEQKAPNTRTDHLGNVISNSCSFHHKMPSHSLLNDTREQKAAL